MRGIYTSIFIVLAILTGCTTSKKEVQTLGNGLWYSENGEKVWFVKDSIILFYPFYPYTKWEMGNDTLRVLDFDGLQVDSPYWFKYPFDWSGDGGFSVKSLEEDEELLKFQRIMRPENADRLPEKLSLLVSDGSFGEELLNLKIEINIPEAKVDFSEGGRSGRDFTCTLDSQELFAIRYLVGKVPWEEIVGPMFSDVVGTKYFSLDIKFKDSGQNRKVLSDMGGSAPPSIDNLITFIWATSQLRCIPEEYRRDLFSH